MSNPNEGHRRTSQFAEIGGRVTPRPDRHSKRVELIEGVKPSPDPVRNHDRRLPRKAHQDVTEGHMLFEQAPTAVHDPVAVFEECDQPHSYGESPMPSVRAAIIKESILPE